MKVSVIVPIYNVERFIRRCVVSLMEQTLYDIEYIFVNDASIDSSMPILEDVVSRYPERIEQVHIIHHDKNRGLPHARNTGLAVAKGEYIYHCDSDDFVEKEMLEHMYAEAKLQDSDFVWCDWFLAYENNERVMKQPDSSSVYDAVIKMLSGSLKYNVWNKLVKRSLYIENEIQFPSGYSMGEDMTMIRLASCSSKVAHVPICLYHYIRTNAGALTHSYSPTHLQELLHNANETIEFLLKRRFVSINDLAYYKLNLKRPFLISDNKESYLIWKSLYPEANSYIMKNKNVSLRTRLLEKMASKDMWFCVWIYNKILYGLIYNFLYRSA